MSICKSEAIVLRRNNLRETSVLADFFTRDFGKITGVLKGMRTEPTKFASSVEPFSLNEIIFYQKRNSSVHLVSACDLKNNFNQLRHDVVRSAMATMMLELVGAVMPLEDKNPAVFELVVSSISELEKTNFAEKILLIFKIKLLSLSGFQPHLDSCVVCDSRVMGQAKFSVSQGGLLCPKCAFKDPKARSIFRGTVATLLHIQKNDFSANLNLGMNPEIKKELEIILNSFIQFHLGKELKSQRVLDDLTAR